METFGNGYMSREKMHDLMRLLFLISFFLAPFLSRSQMVQCTGNLGANIFEDGDFGSGADNILQQNPGIAPGYSYGQSTPPPDGIYVITNDMGAWSNIYDSWLEVGDNSDDPNGYMMVVNASNEPGLFYDQEVDGLCENTLYDFSADVLNVIKSTEGGHIFPDVSFLIDGEVAFNTGNIPQDERWHTYGFTFVTGPGQESVQLSLRNNAPGGFGNDLALDNISFRACGPNALILPIEITNICDDGSPIQLDATIDGDQFQTPALQWQQSFDEGVTWEDMTGENGISITHNVLSSGFYYYRYLLANSDANLANEKCRIISNTKIVQVVPRFYTITDSICTGLSYAVGSNMYFETGNYEDTLISSIGCDSIVRLQLTVVQDPGITASVRTSDLSCHDREDGVLEITNILNGVGPFMVTINGVRNPESFKYIDSLPAGMYALEISDRFGCTYQDLLEIDRPPPFMLTIGPDTTVDLGSSLPLAWSTNDTIDDFRWFPLDQISCQDQCEGQTWQPLNDGFYGLLAFSDQGCVASDSAFVQVRSAEPLFFPNAISPNGDGVNDVFTVYQSNPIIQEVIGFTVFDRWGNALINGAEVYKAGWSGIDVHGQRLPEGIYVYLLSLRLINGEVIDKAGSVTIIR